MMTPTPEPPELVAAGDACRVAIMTRGRPVAGSASWLLG
jgi:hypothetical protein